MVTHNRLRLLLDGGQVAYFLLVLGNLLVERAELYLQRVTLVGDRSGQHSLHIHKVLPVLPNRGVAEHFVATDGLVGHHSVVIVVDNGIQRTVGGRETKEWNHFGLAQDGLYVVVYVVQNADVDLHLHSLVFEFGQRLHIEVCLGCGVDTLRTLAVLLHRGVHVVEVAANDGQPLVHELHCGPCNSPLALFGILVVYTNKLVDNVGRLLWYSSLYAHTDKTCGLARRSNAQVGRQHAGIAFDTTGFDNITWSGFPLLFFCLLAALGNILCLIHNGGNVVFVLNDTHDTHTAIYWLVGSCVEGLFILLSALGIFDGSFVGAIIKYGYVHHEWGHQRVNNHLDGYGGCIHLHFAQLGRHIVENVGIHILNHFVHQRTRTEDCGLVVHHRCLAHHTDVGHCRHIRLHTTRGVLVDVDECARRVDFGRYLAVEEACAEAHKYRYDKPKPVADKEFPDCSERQLRAFFLNHAGGLSVVVLCIVVFHSHNCRCALFYLAREANDR